MRWLLAGAPQHLWLFLSCSPLEIRVRAVGLKLGTKRFAFPLVKFIF